MNLYFFVCLNTLIRYLTIELENFICNIECVDIIAANTQSEWVSEYFITLIINTKSLARSRLLKVIKPAITGSYQSLKVCLLRFCVAVGHSWN